MQCIPQCSDFLLPVAARAAEGFFRCTCKIQFQFVLSVLNTVLGCYSTKEVSKSQTQVSVPPLNKVVLMEKETELATHLNLNLKTGACKFRQ